jgi:hypothetical protein
MRRLSSIAMRISSTSAGKFADLRAAVVFPPYQHELINPIET